MSADFPMISLPSNECESCGCLGGESTPPVQASKAKFSWLHKVRWQSLFKNLFCRSAVVGSLLAAFALPFPAWVIVGVSLLIISKPNIGKAVADMMLTTFLVTAMGILWRSISLVADLNPYLAVVAYLAIALVVGLAGIAFLIVVSSALMAANSKTQFLDVSYFSRHFVHIMLSGTSILGLSAGYWLIAITMP